MTTMTLEFAQDLNIDGTSDLVAVRELNELEVDAVAGGPVPIVLGLGALAALGAAAVWGYETGYNEGRERAERDNAEDQSTSEQ